MKKLRSFAIVDYLKQKKYCSIEELAKHFKVSGATMYRDISELALRNVVQRVYGGVVFLEHHTSASSPAHPPFQERIICNQDKKEAIARQALALIGENDILFLDSSTTVYHLAQLLETSSFSNLTIITNSVAIIQNFHKYPPHYVRIGLGGSYDIQMNSFLGQSTLRQLEDLEISKAFISAFGFGDDKATSNHEYHTGLLRKVLELSERKYLLADRSKCNRSGLFRIAPCRTFDEIISD